MKDEAIVKIIWKDISALRSQWRNHQNALEESRRLFNIEYVSIGQVLEENDDFIVIASTWDRDEEDHCFNDISMILKSVIISKENLN